MRDRVVKEIFSLSGASITIGVAGFLSALVGMFINVDSKVSVKLLFFLTFIFSSLMLILLKIIYDLTLEKKPPPSFENPIKYIKEDSIFVIKRNENFINSIIVGCYLYKDEIDKLAYLAVVHLVQDKVIQLKVHSDLGVLTEIPSTIDGLKDIIIRPVVPKTVLEFLNNKETPNE